PQIPEQLSNMGFIEADFKPLLEVIQERLATRQTGAEWQLNKLAEFRKELHKREALTAMLLEYQKNSAANIPVAKWR
ncbi:MAG: glutamate--cysteine ligase, partial [Gammaproteobacteria bacterium]|nr:glutamate--cysteine ligase [Gammaproteobacteria bacterium]